MKESGSMPNSWIVTTLGKFSTLQRGIDLPEHKRRPGTVPVMGSSGVTGWHDTAPIQGPGVIVGRSGASYGVVSYVQQDFWPLNTALYVRDLHGNDPRFVYFFLKTFPFKNYNSGSAQPSLNRNFVHPAKITIPPVDEQRSIARFLGALDDKIELNRAMNRTLEDMAQAIFKSWFIDFDGHTDFVDSELGPIPRGWRVGKLIELGADQKNSTAAGPFGSKLTRRHYSDCGVPIIRGVNLGRDDKWFHDDDFVFVSEEYAASLESSRAFPGDVLFTQRGTLGQVGLIPKDSRFPYYIISQSQMKLTCADWVPAIYVFLYFSRPETVSYIVANAVAAGVPHINLTFLRNFPVVIPAPDVLLRFRDVMAPIEQRFVHNTRESQTLADLRDTLLPKLISGEVRIPEAEKAVEHSL